MAKEIKMFGLNTIVDLTYDGRKEMYSVSVNGGWDVWFNKQKYFKDYPSAVNYYNTFN